MKIDRCFEKLFGLADAVNSDTIYFNTVHTACFPFSTLSAHRQTISPPLRVMRLKFFPHSPQTKRPLSTFSELYRAVFLVWSEVILLRFCFSSWAFTNCSFGMMRRYFSLESMLSIACTVHLSLPAGERLCFSARFSVILFRLNPFKYNSKINWIVPALVLSTRIVPYYLYKNQRVLTL